MQSYYLKLFSSEISIFCFLTGTIRWFNSLPIQVLTLSSADLIHKAEHAEISFVKLELWYDSIKENKKTDTVALSDISAPISRRSSKWQDNALGNSNYDSMVMAYLCYFL